MGPRASLEMTMTPPRSWQLELVLTSLVAGCLAGQAARRPDPVPFTRLATYALEVDEPGVAVIRDSVQWSTLWREFGRGKPSRWVARGSGRTTQPHLPEFSTTQYS